MIEISQTIKITWGKGERVVRNNTRSEKGDDNKLKIHKTLG